jgi:hypothetical protein
MGAQFALVAMESFRLLPSQFRGGKTGLWLRSMTKLAFKSLTIPQIAANHWLREQRALAK